MTHKNVNRYPIMTKLPSMTIDPMFHASSWQRSCHARGHGCIPSPGRPDQNPVGPDRELALEFATVLGAAWLGSHEATWPATACWGHTPTQEIV